MNNFPLSSLFQINIEIHHLNKQSEKYFGISLVQWCLLKHLIDMPATSAHMLANATGVHPSTLTQTLKRLEKKKYIFISDNPKDSRKKLISITRTGKEILDLSSEKINVFSEGLSDLNKELFQIHSFLKKQSIFQKRTLPQMRE